MRVRREICLGASSFHAQRFVKQLQYYIKSIASHTSIDQTVPSISSQDVVFNETTCWYMVGIESKPVLTYIRRIIEVVLIEYEHRDVACRLGCSQQRGTT